MQLNTSESLLGDSQADNLADQILSSIRAKLEHENN